VSGVRDGRIQASQDHAKKLSERLSAADVQANHGSLSLPADTSVSGHLAVLEGSLDLATGSRFDGELWVVNGTSSSAGRPVWVADVNLVNGDLFRSAMPLSPVMSGDIDAPVASMPSSTRKDRRLSSGCQRPESLAGEVVRRTRPTNRVDYSSLYVGVKRGNPDDRVRIGAAMRTLSRRFA